MSPKLKHTYRLCHHFPHFPNGATQSVIKLNYIPAHQWNFHIFQELLRATHPSVWVMQHSLQMKPSSSPKGQSVWKLHTWLGSMHSPEFSQWKNSPHAESVEVRSINPKC